MIDPNDMLKQMLQFNKSTFDNSFNALATVQEQNEKMVSTFLEQATWLPDEGKGLIREWVAAYKKGMSDFKDMADANYQKVVEYFETSAKKK
jgi:predicted nucleic-acid-binding protein